MIEEFAADKERVLAYLRQQRADAKARMATAEAEYKSTDEAITALERVGTTDAATLGPAIMVEAGEFAACRTPTAVGAVMIRNPRPLRKAEIVSAIERGGFPGEPHKIRQNVGSTLKAWRRARWASLNEADSTWQLTGKGRVELSRPAETGTARANARSLSAEEG